MPAWPSEFEEILRERCGRLRADDEIPPDVPLATLGVDSLGMLMFVLQTEEAFGITLPETVLAGDDVNTPGSMWETVRRLLGARADG